MKIAEHLGVEIPRATPDEAVQRAFQEKGRDISSRVREIGGTGLSAEVRKALAEAYAVGFAAGRGELPVPQSNTATSSAEDAPYNMALVPPNARSCFEGLVYGMYDVDKISDFKIRVFVQAKPTILDGPRTTRWILGDYTVKPARTIESSAPDKTFGGLTLSPLVKHGLLRDAGGILFLTDTGVATLNFMLAMKKKGILPYQLKWPADRNK